MQVYAELRALRAELVPTWRSTRRASLALLASAISSRRSLSLSELARAYPGGFSHDVRKKRLRRFLNNRGLDLVGAAAATDLLGEQVRSVRDVRLTRINPAATVGCQSW